ncbi:MAG: hypothetical protein ABJA89_17470 [Lapillicoccus sp.]
MSGSQLDPQRAANLAENPHAGHGMVMLDIGGDVGAVVLHLPASLEGAEVEIEAVGGAAGHTHGEGHVHGEGHDHGEGHVDDHPHSPGHEHGDDPTHTHDHPHRPHVAVVGRPVGDHMDYSAVFPTLTEGSYALFVPGAASPVLVEVRGGEVSEADWSDDGGSA